MPPKPEPFRFKYRSFERIEFEPSKSEEVFEARGFDLEYVSRMFPGYVLEREDTRGYAEPRFQAIGELLGEIFFVVYTVRARTCRIITAWVADPHERALWYDLSR